MTKDLTNPEFDDETQTPAPEVSTPSPDEVAEPTKKRAYKQRAPKLKAETLDASETPARKPRRSKANIEKSARQIEGIHKMVAMLPHMAFMELKPEEAQILAEGMAGVAEEYDIQVSGKAAASIQLFAAAMMIYAPRAMVAIEMRKAAKKATPGNLPTVLAGQENSGKDSTQPNN